MVARLPNAVRRDTMPALTYRAAGVDIDAGEELVRRIAPAVARTRRPELLTALGGFAGVAALPAGYREPVLVVGTDGVGTKLRLAIDHGHHDGVGQDLVAMCVNDVLAVGAEPFLFLDYYATGALDVDIAERVVTGIARACELAGCALAGGETAEMPGFHKPGDYELAGFCVGVGERSRIVTGDGGADGDALVGVASSGPHANGYSLIRRVLQNSTEHVSDSLLEQLLRPTRIYVAAARALQGALKGASHITGGGFVDNLPRMFTADLVAHIHLDSWPRPPVFEFLQRAGGIDELEMWRVFNNGIGFVACVSASDAERVCADLATAGEDARVIGRLARRGAAVGPRRLVVAHGHAELT